MEEKEREDKRQKKKIEERMSLKNYKVTDGKNNRGVEKRETSPEDDILTHN